jgi:hypothetical protein
MGITPDGGFSFREIITVRWECSMCLQGTDLGWQVTKVL